MALRQLTSLASHFNMSDNLNVGDIGSVIRVNIGYAVTASANSLVLQPEVGDKKVFTDGVSAPDVTVITDLETFTAGQYIEYKTKKGDLSKAGRWRKKAVLNFAPDDVRFTSFERFRVLD